MKKKKEWFQRETSKNGNQKVISDNKSHATLKMFAR